MTPEQPEDHKIRKAHEKSKSTLNSRVALSENYQQNDEVQRQQRHKSRPGSGYG